MANVGLPSLAAAFDASFAQIQWVVLAYLLAMWWLDDRFGRQRRLGFSVLLCNVASLGCELATHIGWLIVSCIQQGLGGAMIMVNMLLAIRRLPAERTGRVMGLLGTISAISRRWGRRRVAC